MKKLGVIGSFPDIKSVLDNDERVGRWWSKWWDYFLYLHEAGQADHHRHHQRGDDVDQGPEHEMAHYQECVLTPFN